MNPDWERSGDNYKGRKWDTCSFPPSSVIRSTYAQDSVQEPSVMVGPNVEQHFCTEETGGMVCEGIGSFNWENLV